MGLILGRSSGSYQKKVEAIFEDLKQCLQEAIEGDNTRQASADEINTMCEKCAELYILFDGLFVLS